jgi:hypothetical protein
LEGATGTYWIRGWAGPRAGLDAIERRKIMEKVLPSFPSALQLRVSIGLLNNLPPFFSIPRLADWFLNNLVFMV